MTDQDGFRRPGMFIPEETFWPAHNLMMKTLEGEGITFDEIFIDRSMPEDLAPTRKPRTGMLTKYLNNPEYDLAGSLVYQQNPFRRMRNWLNSGFLRAIYLPGGTTFLETGQKVELLLAKVWKRYVLFFFTKG